MYDVDGVCFKFYFRNKEIMNFKRSTVTKKNVEFDKSDSNAMMNQ